MSRTKMHMVDNFNIFDFTLTDEEMERISALDRGQSAFFSHQNPEMEEWFVQMVEARKKPEGQKVQKKW